MVTKAVVVTKRHTAININFVEDGGIIAQRPTVTIAKLNFYFQKLGQ